MYKTKLNTLFTFARSGLKDQRLTVTYLGRGFKAIENMGWCWVCRVRGNVQLSKDGKNWQQSREWFVSANSKAITLGDIYFSKTTQHPCIGTLYKGRKKNE